MVKNIFIALLLVSCSGDKTLEIKEIISIDPKDAEEVFFGSFIKNAELIKLESSEDGLISSIDKLIVHQNEYYILDEDGIKGVVVYDKTGSFKYSITKKGRGPGELVGPTDFDLDISNNQIVILDGGRRKIIKFDIQTGEFIDEEVIEYYPEKIKIFDDRYILFMNNEINKRNSQLIVLDRDMNIDFSFLDIDKNLLNYNIVFKNNFREYNDQLYITTPSDNNIYRLDHSNQITVAHQIISPGHELPDRYYEDNIEQLERFNLSLNSVCFISDYYRSDVFYFFSYRYGLTKGFYLSSLRSNSVIHTNNDFLVDDLGIGPLGRTPHTSNGNHIVWSQSPEKLEDYLANKQEDLSEEEWEEFQITNSDLLEFSTSLRDVGNPYLILTEIDF